MAGKYSSIYYPECYITDSSTLTTYLTIYDELHLVALTDDAENPTEYLRGLPDYSIITSIKAGERVEFGVSSTEIRTKAEVGEIDANTKRILRYYQFIQRYKSLIGNSLFFHPHLLASVFTRARKNILGGEANLMELFDIFSGQDSDLRLFKKFQEEYPEIKDEAVWRIVPTAMKLAEQNGFLMVSDDPALPVPVLSNKVPSVKELTSILAQECVRIYVPRCRDASPEDIVELRKSLSEVLQPFRLSLQKLSGDLRQAIETEADMRQLHEEAKFIAESKIEPAVYELRQCIEKSNSKLFNRIFGKVLSWVPFIAKAYAIPTPDNILGVAKKIGGDTNAILDSVDEAHFTKKQGLSFLLKFEDAMTKKD